MNKLLKRNLDKELDSILKWLLYFVNNDKYTEVEFLPAVDIVTYSNKNVTIEELNESDTILYFTTGTNNYSEAHLLLQHLKEEGYVDEDFSNPNQYRINLKGIIFINNGGYRKQRKLNKLKEENEKVKDFFNKLNIFVIIILTIVSLFMTYNNNDKEKRIYDLERSIKDKEDIIKSLELR